ncbi:MAG: hypothetical protein ACE5FL_12620 [Myxococcota bacterium]
MIEQISPSRDSSPRRWLDPFRVLTTEERRRHLDAYASFQEERNGDIDLPRRALSLRDAYLRDLDRNPIRWRGELDREGFLAWQQRAGRPELDPRAVFLVVIGKINESERYGVELELARFNETDEHTSDRQQLYLFLEEGYHSRILMEVCRTCGLDLETRVPPWGTRWLIHLVRYLPDRIRWIPILCGEVVGCTVFKILMDHVGVFSEQPEVEERIRSLVGEIWLDEVMHVAFVRARLGRLGMLACKLLLPIVARSLTSDVPTLTALGCSKAELMERVRRGVEMPSGAAWIDPEPAPA